jgi:hypothetical protein
MRIHIDGELAEPFFEAINDAPFSDAFKASFINEVLTTPGLRFGASGILGFFDGADITAIDGFTDEFVTRARLSRPANSWLPHFGHFVVPPR